MPLLLGPFVRCRSSATLLVLWLIFAGFTCTVCQGICPEQVQWGVGIIDSSQESMFDKKGWQLYAMAQLRLSWVLPTPTPVTQLALCFSDS
eukprot:superscaffoldBa00000006_g118